MESKSTSLLITHATEHTNVQAGQRVALAPGSIDGGGIGTAMLNLAEGLVGHGVEVDILLTTEPKDGRRIPAGASVHVLGTRTRKSFGAARHYLRTMRPDMVITARNYMHILIGAVLRSIGSHNIIHTWTFHTHRTTEITKARFKDKLVDWLAIAAIGTANHIVAVSQGVADDLEQGTRLKPGQVKVIPNAAWHSRYLDLAMTPHPHPWLEDTGIPVILGIGRLAPQKDFETLISSFAGLKTPARLIILGEGEDRENLEELISRLGLNDAVLLPGHVSNVFAWLARARLFVLSSQWEGFGMVLVESLGCGTPVISTDCPSGPSEIINSEELGALVPVADVKAMTSAMEAAISSQKLVPNNATSAYEFDRVARQFLSILARS